RMAAGGMASRGRGAELHRGVPGRPAWVRDARRARGAVRAPDAAFGGARRLVSGSGAVQAGVRARGALREVRARRERPPHPRAVRRAGAAAGSTGERADRLICRAGLVPARTPGTRPGPRSGVMELAGKVALVTGASRGIGRA